MAHLDFNAHEVDPATGFDPIPAGKYLCIITDSEMKPTKAGTGQYLELTLQVVEGDFTGRLLWARLNLDNPNRTAVEIARKELSAICHAVGVMTPKDSVELHGLPMVVTVGCKKREDNDEIVNEVKSYAPRETAQGQPQQAQSNTPPWKR